MSKLMLFSLIIVLSSCRLSERRSIDYKEYIVDEFKPTSDGGDTTRIVPNDKFKPTSLKYYFKDKLIGADTLLYIGNKLYYVPIEAFGKNGVLPSFFKVSVSLGDSTRFFYFNQYHGKYLIAAILTNMNDSCVKIQFVRNRRVELFSITSTVLDSLSNYAKYEELYEEYFQLKYFSFDRGVKYKIEEYIYDRVHPLAGFDTIYNDVNHLYFNIDSLVYKELLPYSYSAGLPKE